VNNLDQPWTDVEDDEQPSAAEPKSVAPRVRGGALGLTYLGALFFAVVYFGRPGDWIPGLSSVPLAKIAVVFPIIGIVGAILMGNKLRFQKELKILTLLFFDLMLCIPFSTWRGGSFDTVLFVFGKAALIAVILVQVLITGERIRRMMLVQTVAFMVVMALTLRSGITQGGRLVGVLGGIFSNPNDLAAGVASVLPFAVMFLLLTRNIVKRLFWLGGIILMLYGVGATYSRGGFITMAAGILAIAWYFGAKGARKKLLVMIVVAALIVPLLLSGSYALRLESIFDRSLDVSGSETARGTLLIRSLELAATHPLFGVGPGQFVVESGSWHAAHNSYTEMFAEAGIAGGILFLALFWTAFQRLRKPTLKSNAPRELWLLRAAALSSLATFVISGCFASLEYQFFPYFLIAYCISITALVQEESEVIKSESNWKQRQAVLCAE